MPSNTSARKLGLTTAERRHSIVLSYLNGGLWGAGSGLASVTLVTYLAREFGALGWAVSLLLAAPAMVGLLRLLTPLWLEKVGSRRRFCIWMFLSSAVVLFALPIISAPHVLPLPAESIAALSTTWVGYHVLEYMGAVALWSWFGDLAPARIRGRFVARRQAWVNVGKISGTLVAAVGTYVWMNHCDDTGQLDQKWKAYAACSLAGAVFYAAAVWPLQFMRDLPLRYRDELRFDSLRRQLLGPWADRKFRKLLRFGLWFSLSNGLIQTAQFMFLADELKLSFVEKKGLDSGSRGIQSMIMPYVGSWVDRHGNVRVLTISQTLIAFAPLFFLLATPDARWWVLGAYLLWLGYAGENVTQPNLMLSLSPSGETPAYASAWFAWTQLAYSLSVLGGGLLFDWLAANFTPVSWNGLTLDHYALLFIASWLLKSFGAYLAARIRE